jgi:hypothetical protein
MADDDPKPIKTRTPVDNVLSLVAMASRSVLEKSTLGTGAWGFTGGENSTRQPDTWNVITRAQMAELLRDYPWAFEDDGGTAADDTTVARTGAPKVRAARKDVRQTVRSILVRFTASEESDIRRESDRLGLPFTSFVRAAALMLARSRIEIDIRAVATPPSEIPPNVPEQPAPSRAPKAPAPLPRAKTRLTYDSAGDPTRVPAAADAPHPQQRPMKRPPFMAAGEAIILPAVDT